MAAWWNASSCDQICRACPLPKWTNDIASRNSDMVPTTRDVVARSCCSRYTSTAAISVRIPNPMVIEVSAQRW